MDSWISTSPPSFLHCSSTKKTSSIPWEWKQPSLTSSPLVRRVLCSKLNLSLPRGTPADASTALQSPPIASLRQISAEAEKTVLLITCLILSLSFPGAHQNTTQRFVALLFGGCLITSNPAREEDGFQQRWEASGLARPPPVTWRCLAIKRRF